MRWWGWWGWWDDNDDDDEDEDDEDDEDDEVDEVDEVDEDDEDDEDYEDVGAEWCWMVLNGVEGDVCGTKALKIKWAWWGKYHEKMCDSPC